MRDDAQAEARSQAQSIGALQQSIRENLQLLAQRLEAENSQSLEQQQKITQVKVIMKATALDPNRTINRNASGPINHSLDQARDNDTDSAEPVGRRTASPIRDRV